MTDALEKKTWSRAEVERLVMETIIEEGMVDAALVTPEATIESLSIESIDFVIILNGLEERFDIYIPFDQQVTDIETVGDLVDEMFRRLNGPPDAQI